MIERLKLSGIYAILNILNEKVYVGSAIHLYRRWRDHKSNLRINKNNCLLLQRAWNKYGEENFIFVVLELVEDRTKLVELETAWIKCLDSANVELGYNILPTAYSRLGLKASEETKAKMSLASKGKPKSDEMKAKLSASKMGHSVSEEARIKIGLAGIGRKPHNRDNNKWPHEKGNKCNCRECLNRKNLKNRERKCNFIMLDNIGFVFNDKSN